MHKLTSKPITIDCFEIDDYQENLENWIDSTTNYEFNLKQAIEVNISMLEGLRQKYLEAKAVRFWKELIRWTPESWLQTRTVTMNYENLLAMCSKSQRRFHKLNEWSGRKDDSLDNFISFARELPYAADFIFLDEAEQE